MNNKKELHSITYRNKVWYFLARPKKRIRGRYHCYYISNDLKDVIDWDYSDDFVLVKPDRLIDSKIISAQDIERYKKMRLLGRSVGT